MPSERARPVLYAVIAAAILVAVAAFWLPRWWENREYRRAEKIAGIGSPVLPGSLVRSITAIAFTDRGSARRKAATSRCASSPRR